MALWDEEDEFYYDVLQLPDGRRMPLKVRSIVGLIPLFAVETLDRRSTASSCPASRDAWTGSSSIGPTWQSLVSRWHEHGMRRAPPAGSALAAIA